MMNAKLPQILTFRPPEDIRAGMIRAKEDGRMTSWMLSRGLRRELTEMGYMKPRRRAALNQSQGEHKSSS